MKPLSNSIFSKLLGVGALFFGLLFSSTSSAQSSMTFQASTTMVKECRISVSSDLNFGVYDPVVTHYSTKPLASTSVNMLCTVGTVYTIRANQGRNYYQYRSSSRPAYSMANDSCIRQMRSQDNSTIRYRVGTSSGSMSPNLELPEYYYGQGGTGPSCLGGWSTLVTGTATASGLAMSLHAKIQDASSSDAKAGSYTDVLTINVMF